MQALASCVTVPLLSLSKEPTHAEHAIITLHEHWVHIPQTACSIPPFLLSFGWGSPLSSYISMITRSCMHSRIYSSKLHATFMHETYEFLVNLFLASFNLWRASCLLWIFSLVDYRVDYIVYTYLFYMHSQSQLLHMTYFILVMKIFLPVAGKFCLFFKESAGFFSLLFNYLCMHSFTAWA